MSENIIEKLLDGEALSCIMTPDDSISGYGPLHEESMSLPHVVIKDEFYWGMSLHGYFAVNAPSGNYFYFSNYKNIYGTFAPDAAMRDLATNCNISSLDRYSAFKFVTRNHFRLIWDSNGEKDFDAVRQAVHESVPLRVALLDHEDIWNLHPVMLPQIEKNADHFILQTHSVIYPGFFRNQAGLDDFWYNLEPYVCDPKVYKQNLMAIKSAYFIGAYHISDNGHHKSAYDLLRGNTDNEHKQLKIFAEIR